MKILSGTLKHLGQTCLTDLSVMLFEIPIPQTGQINQFGLLSFPKEQPINPNAFTLVLSDNRIADILIKSSTLRGEKRAVFFSVIGGFHDPLPPLKFKTLPLSPQRIPNAQSFLLAA
jgi:hypothetical protein